MLDGAAAGIRVAGHAPAGAAGAPDRAGTGPGGPGVRSLVMVMRPFLTRRTFLADLGRGSVALAVLGVAGCAAASTTPRRVRGGRPAAPRLRDTAARVRARPSRARPRPARRPDRRPPAVSTGPASTSASSPRTSSSGAARRPLSIPAWRAARTTSPRHSRGIGLDWEAVAHVILTHKHGDHAGSLADVLAGATAATAYAGAADLEAIRTAAGIGSRGRCRPLPTARWCSACGSSRRPATPWATSRSSTRSAGSSWPATPWGRSAASWPARTRSSPRMRPRPRRRSRSSAPSGSRRCWSATATRSRRGAAAQVAKLAAG